VCILASVCMTADLREKAGYVCLIHTSVFHIASSSLGALWPLL
jgi:hypothetical protein